MSPTRLQAERGRASIDAGVPIPVPSFFHGGPWTESRPAPGGDWGLPRPKPGQVAPLCCSPAPAGPASVGPVPVPGACPPLGLKGSRLHRLPCPRHGLLASQPTGLHPAAGTLTPPPRCDLSVCPAASAGAPRLQDELHVSGKVSKTSAVRARHSSSHLCCVSHEAPPGPVLPPPAPEETKQPLSYSPPACFPPPGLYPASALCLGALPPFPPTSFFFRDCISKRQ